MQQPFSRSMKTGCDVKTHFTLTEFGQSHSNNNGEHYLKSKCPTTLLKCHREIATTKGLALSLVQGTHLAVDFIVLFLMLAHQTSCLTANHSDRLPKIQNKKELCRLTIVSRHESKSATLRAHYTQYNYLLTSQPGRESFHFFNCVSFKKKKKIPRRTPSRNAATRSQTSAIRPAGPSRSLQRTRSTRISDDVAWSLSDRALDWRRIAN